MISCSHSTICAPHPNPLPKGEGKTHRCSATVAPRKLPSCSHFGDVG